MLKRLISAAVVLALFAFSTVHIYAEDQSTVVIDTDKTYQTIDGFGASYTWYSEQLSTTEVAQQGFDWIFNDAKFNMLRFRDLNCVYTNNRDEVLEGYKSNYYLYYNAAVERGIDPLVIVTSWGEYDRSLPWVEFVENPENGYSYYTLAKDSSGEYMYDALADFCVESITIFFDAGIPVDYFSITNEAELQDSHLDEKGGQRDSAGFFLGKEETDYQAAYWKAHIAVYDAFKEAFGEYAPSLLGAETMAAYPDLLHGYLDPLIESRPETVEVVAHHLYGTDFSERNLTAVGEAFPDLKIYQTEYYEGDFFRNAEVVLDDLVYEGVNAYLYWDGVWPMGAVLDVSSTGGSTTLTRRGNHYIMSHFSAFIGRGYKRVDVQDSLNTKFGAFKSPDGGKLIVIAMNPTKEAESLTLDIGENEVLSSKVYLSTEDAENAFKNKYLQDMGEYTDGMELPGRSLTTIEFDLAVEEEYIPEEAPVREENPFVKTEKSGISFVIAIIAFAVAAAVCAVVCVLIFRRKKRTSDSSGEKL